MCDYCRANPAPDATFSHLSSGDVTMKFDSGSVWKMPDMILHYVADHGWLPPADFMDDVMNHELVGGRRAQTKGVPLRVGYLSGPFQKGPVPEGLVDRLEALMKQAAKMGSRVQCRGLRK